MTLHQARTQCRLSTLKLDTAPELSTLDYYGIPVLLLVMDGLLSLVNGDHPDGYRIPMVRSELAP